MATRVFSSILPTIWPCSALVIRETFTLQHWLGYGLLLAGILVLAATRAPA